MTASVLTVTERVNTVTFDATLMEPATAYVAHLYDMEGLVFDHAGLQYFVEHYRTTALVEGCRVGWTRYGSITRLELVDQDDPTQDGPHRAWFKHYHRPLPWTQMVWEAWEYFTSNVTVADCPPEMVGIVEELRAIVAA